MIDTEQKINIDDCEKILDYVDQTQNIFEQIDDFANWTDEIQKEVDEQQQKALANCGNNPTTEKLLEVLVDGPFLAPIMYKLLAKNIKAFEAMNKNSEIIENIINEKMNSKQFTVTDTEKKALYSFLNSFVKLQELVKQCSKKAMIEAYKNACVELNLPEKDELNTLDQYANDPEIEKEASEAFEDDLNSLKELIEKFK